MARLIGGTAAGILGWFVLATLLNLALRHGWPDYAAVEKAMAFTLAMMAARLLVSAASSIGSGFLAARIGGVRAATIAGAILLLMFLPIHYMLWQRFPAWYHLAFLASLPLLGWLGGRLARGGSR
ncbi:hypothetical protein [Sphingomonas fennica]|uniref:Uncharacterized protein n=1 Tax=Edaphosphingomonas fennica TaxID=114404 RepID=A0A2T4I2T0_9SPHN|nr:hypothetical protein [Sphingomonas fennica]PTD23404.1 hypothetical protein CV103_08815 [Sphingomonas fennica]